MFQFTEKNNKEAMGFHFCLGCKTRIELCTHPKNKKKPEKLHTHNFS